MAERQNIVAVPLAGASPGFHAITGINRPAVIPLQGGIILHTYGMAGWFDTTGLPENVAVYAVNGSLRHILNSISHIGKAEHLRPGPAFPVTTSLNTHTCRDGQPAQNRSFKFSGIAAVFKKRSFRAMCKLHPQKRRHSPSSCILNASGNFRLDQPRSVVPFPMSVHTVAEPAFHAVISHSPSKIGFHRPQGTLSGAEYPPPINASH